VRPRTALPITITPYQRRNLQAVRDLMFRNQAVHTHLDWHETDHWMETHNPPMRLGWHNGRLVGALAMSPPLNNTSWIRLAALSDRVDHGAVITALWENLKPELKAAGVKLVALLAVREWITAYAPDMGFNYIEDIITLTRAGQHLPEPPANRLLIRSAETYDLETMARLDQAAFSPPWQLSYEELRQAHRISASCTVALGEGRILGYQLSTLYFDGSHLARLAVHPQAQGNGVGRALLDDVLRRFLRRGVYSMSLNTQASNLHSQHLYRHFGFRPNGYDLPYWSATL
jgi:ribosomal-protein-alanine N-acetyltransferase